jgi:hypothetical protein
MQLWGAARDFLRLHADLRMRAETARIELMAGKKSEED